MIQRIKAPSADATPPAAPGLDALAAQAADLEGAALPPGEAPPPPPDTAGELRQALDLARALAAPSFAWWPDFERVWSDAALDRIAQAGAAVMELHGWTVGDMLGRWGPYLALVGATAPPALATWAAIRAQRDAPPPPPPEPAPAAP